MELKETQLREIGEQVSHGDTLDKVLTTQFSGAEIAVIRGYDNFSEEAYIKGAFFNEGQARQVMAKIPSNGSLPDTYHIVTGTINDLMEGRINDERTLLPLDNLDRSMVYASLQKRLSR